jgi:HlyD family secretion protein
MMVSLAFFKTKIGIITVAATISVVFGFFYFSKDSDLEYEYIVAGNGTVVQEVSVTGRVVPAESVDLAFERGGRVAWVYRLVGDVVYPGEALVSLESSEIEAELAQANANVAVQEAKLAELLRGTREEELRVGEVKVANAKVALTDAKQNLVDKLRDAYTKSDDAIRHKVDQFFSNPRTSNPQINFSVSGQLKINIESGRVDVERMLGSWNTIFVSLSAESALLAEAVSAKDRMIVMNGFLVNVATALNELTVSAGMSQATIDGYRSDVSSARTNINTASANLTIAEEKLRSATSALALAEEELALLRAGTREEAIIAKRAEIMSSRATVALYDAQLAKTVLRAPIQGTVTLQDARVGEIVSANVILTSLISESKFEIETNVPEADIVKVVVGQNAEVTLDAYGRDETFFATVVSVDPAEIIIEGVPTYKVTLQFVADDERVRSGMTANIDIVSGIKEDVIFVPSRSIVRQQGEKFVRILSDDGIVSDVIVVTGLVGSEGNTEIASGVVLGDKVLLYLPDEN